MGFRSELINLFLAFFNPNFLVLALLKLFNMVFHGWFGYLWIDLPFPNKTVPNLRSGDPGVQRTAVSNPWPLNLNAIFGVFRSFQALKWPKSAIFALRVLKLGTIIDLFMANLTN